MPDRVSGFWLVAGPCNRYYFLYTLKVSLVQPEEYIEFPRFIELGDLESKSKALNLIAQWKGNNIIKKLLSGKTPQPKLEAVTLVGGKARVVNIFRQQIKTETGTRELAINDPILNRDAGEMSTAINLKHYPLNKQEEPWTISKKIVECKRCHGVGTNPCTCLGGNCGTCNGRGFLAELASYPTFAGQLIRGSCGTCGGTGRCISCGGWGRLFVKIVMGINKKPLPKRLLEPILPVKYYPYTILKQKKQLTLNDAFCHDRRAVVYPSTAINNDFYKKYNLLGKFKPEDESVLEQKYCLCWRIQFNDKRLEVLFGTNGSVLFYE